MADDDLGDFQAVMSEISQLIDAKELPRDLIGDLDITEVIEAVSGLVSGELGNLQGLSDDPAENENVLRSVVQAAAMKAFFSGLAIGSARGTPAFQESDLVVPLSTDSMEQLGVRILRDGVVTLHLVTPEEDI